MNALRSIALVANAQLRFLMVDVARELRARHGSRIHLYCGDAQEKAFYQNLNSENVFDNIEIYEPLLRYPVPPVSDAAAEIATARTYEARLGRTYNFIAVANRHLGRGYALAGNYHPRSRWSEQTSYIQLVSLYNRYFAFWDRETREKGLSMVLGGPAEFTNAARLNSLPYRRLAGSRYENFQYWAHTEFIDNPALAVAYRSASPVSPEVAAMPRAYKLVGTTARAYGREDTLLGMLYLVAFRFAQQVYWRLRGYQKGQGYLLRDELGMLVRRWYHSRRMTGPRMATLKQVAGSQFLFFPLATEPELALQQFSPEFFFQHAAIAALSRELPAGIKLVVKESIFGVGKRPHDFYDQITELKNVVWLDMLEPGLEVARHAAAVAVITGSTGFEAAVMGKPVVSFGIHNGYNMLPHVFHVTDLTKLGDAIRAIFDGRVNEVEARREGARYLQAVIDSSFDLGEYDFVNLKKYDQRIVRSACDELERSLEFLG